MMKSRLQEVETMIAEDDFRNKSEYRRLVSQYNGEDAAQSFDRWLKRRISLEIERAALLNETK